jgi:ketosteroid isomerase-like protein
MALLLTFALPGFSQNSGPSASDLDRQAIQFERDRQDAFVRGDVEMLDRTTAEDYTTINAAGNISTKPQMMANLRAHKTKVLSVKLTELKGRMYGNTAIVTGLYDDVNIGADGAQKQVHARFTRIFQNEDGAWKAVAYQQTAAPEK